MKRVIAILLIALVALGYGACGAASPAAKGDASVANAPAAPPPNPGTSLSSNQNLPENKKIIRNARLGIEAEDAQAAYTELRNWVVENGGYEFSSETSKSGNYWVVSAQLKLSPDRLDAFLDYAKTRGELINCIISSNDITDKYVDTRIRLDNAKRNLDKYYEFLKQAVNIDETLKVQNEINRLVADIESYEGLLKLWDSQVAESTIEVSIREKQDPTKIKKEIDWNAITFSDMLSLMKNGFIMVTNTVISVLQWLLIIIVAAIPVLLIAAAVLYIRKRLKKRKKQAQTPANKAIPAQKPDETGRKPD
jgi:hypothetical protein